MHCPRICDDARRINTRGFVARADVAFDRDFRRGTPPSGPAATSRTRSRPSAAAERIAVYRSDVSPADFRFEVDPDLLSQAAINLLNNAIDAVSDAPRGTIFQIVLPAACRIRPA